MIFLLVTEFGYVRSRGVVLFLKKQLINIREELIVKEGSYVSSSSDLYVPSRTDRIIMK